MQKAYICHFADVNSIYSIQVQVWFYENHMVLDPGNFHYLTIIKYISNESVVLSKDAEHAEAELFGVIIR